MENCNLIAQGTLLLCAESYKLEPRCPGEDDQIPDGPAEPLMVCKPKTVECLEDFLDTVAEDSRNVNTPWTNLYDLEDLR